MSSSGELAPPATAGVGSLGPRLNVSTSPIAVVWCRQVDNEAESPGYTTVPEEFPGHRETLDVIRIVGNLTVNVADTHDYWDPDPSQPLSYYPNLFLYPAFSGRYTCVGRMFLSTEDRPRLGMKTLVLDTGQLLNSGEFGPTILRWHASMGGPRREGSRPPPVPDPNLFNLLGEGFLFHRGSSDPVVIVASDEWEPAMQAILELVRVMPASLVGLGAILAFPYFLPQPKTNLNEFTEQLPLALALMRVPRAEASGDRHNKRLSSWKDSPVTLRDITDGVPAASGKGKDALPLVLQFARDHNEQKLRPIVQRVDLIEMPRLKPHLADPERQGGKDRRKEMWRIGTAMESAALLLQRARGRHVPVNVETAKRAQEYIQARVPVTAELAPMVEPEVAAVVTPTLAPAAAAQHPPWLQRSTDGPPAPSPDDRTEVVPVSVSEDPSLLSAEARARSGVTPPVPSPVAPTASGPSPADLAAVRQQVEIDLLKYVEQRLPLLIESSSTKVAQGLEAKLAAQVDARADARFSEGLAESQAALKAAIERRVVELLAIVRQQGDQQLKGSVAEAEGRFQAALATAVSGATASQRQGMDELRAATDRRLADAATVAREKNSQELQARLLESETRLKTDWGKAIAAGTAAQSTSLDALRTLLERRTIELLAAAKASGDQDRAKALTELESRVTEKLLQATATELAAQADSAESTRAAIERRLTDLTENQNKAIAAAVTQLQQRIQELDTRFVQDGASQSTELEARLREGLMAAVGVEVGRQVRSVVDPRMQEVAQRTQEVLTTRQNTALEQLRAQIAGASEELRVKFAKSEDAMRAGLSAQLDLQLREAEERAAAARAALQTNLNDGLAQQLAEAEGRRLKEAKELEARLGLLLDGRSRESMDRTQTLHKEHQARVSALLDERFPAAEARVLSSTDQRIGGLKEAQAAASADLQVRIQSYVEQKLREGQDRERDKYVELLARLKTDVDGAIAKLTDSPKFDSAVRDRIDTSLSSLRSETETLVDQRVAAADAVGAAERTEAVQRLEALERDLDVRGRDLQTLEETIHADLDEVDRRTSILSERLVPVVRKTWLRIAELEKAAPGGADTEAQINAMRREFQREMRRLEEELNQRAQELRERMETTISHQGKVWLTLVRQLSQLTEDRRALESHRPPPNAGSRAAEEEARTLEELPALIRPRGRNVAPSDDETGAIDLVVPPEDPPEAPAEPEESSRSTRARGRRTGSR